MFSGACCVLSALYVVSGDKISAVTQISEVAVMGIYLYLGITNYFSHQPILFNRHSGKRVASIHYVPSCYVL